MPRSSAETRKRILDAGYALFRRKGFTRVSMDDIAAAAEVTKRTLYYHFESKDELLTDVFEAQHALAYDAFRTFGDRLSGTPEKIIETLFRDLAVWADTPRWAGSGFTRLVVELADLRGHPARAVARRHKALLERHLCELLERAHVPDAKRSAREIWILLEGAISLMLVHGDRAYAAAAAQAAKCLLRCEVPARSSTRARARLPNR